MNTKHEDPWKFTEDNRLSCNVTIPRRRNLRVICLPRKFWAKNTNCRLVGRSKQSFLCSTLKREKDQSKHIFVYLHFLAVWLLSQLCRAGLKFYKNKSSTLFCDFCKRWFLVGTPFLMPTNLKVETDRKTRANWWIPCVSWSSTDYSCASCDNAAASRLPVHNILPPDNNNNGKHQAETGTTGRLPVCGCDAGYSPASKLLSRFARVLYQNKKNNAGILYSATIYSTVNPRSSFFTL